MEQQVISSDLIRGHIDTIILHTLLSGDKFAQQISDAIEEKSDKEYKINQATLYSSLKRLESLRYVKSYWHDSENGRRKYFKLTDSGKNTVETNLSSWSFSRAIIDKLMDCSPQPIYRTQYVERIIEKPVETAVATPASAPATLPQESLQKPTEPVVAEQNIQQEQKPEEKPTETLEPTRDAVQDINFRNILNGLIKASVVQKPSAPVAEEIQPLERTDIQEKPVEVQKFNETISSIDYNAARNNNGKIDFGDLTLKAAKEGYKIRISSKDSCITVGNLLINKLNLAASFFTYLVALVALFIVSYAVANNAVWNKYVCIIGAIILAVVPMFYAVKYIKSPNTTSSKQTTPNDILTSAIVVFDLVLITVAANLIFNVDFSVINTIALTLVLPTVMIVVLGLYSVVKFYFSKLKTFKIKVK